MKIAVCISGDCLTWNETSKTKLKDFLKLFDQYQFHFYGHTWDDCEVPVTDLIKFEKIVIESKTIIDDWVRAEFVTRAFHDPYQMKPFIRNDKNDYIRFVTEAIALTTKNYSPFISALTCFNIPDIEDYDALIKVSWNCNFTELDNPYICRQIGKVFERAVNATNEGLSLCFSTHYTRIASKNSGPLHADAIPVAVPSDFVIFTKEAIRAFNKNNAFDRLIGANRMLPKSSINVKNNVLWGELIKNAKIHIECTLPDIFENMVTAATPKNNDIFF